MEALMNVVEVQIAEPHTRRVIAEGRTAEAAESFIRMAVFRRGVETHFYVAEPLTDTDTKEG